MSSLRIIKLTSPNLNYFLLAGLAATAVSFLDYPSTVHAVTVAECTVCNMHTQLLQWQAQYELLFFIMQNTKILSYLGYDVVIGVALVKTARVYYIFKKPSPNKKVLM